MAVSMFSMELLNVIFPLSLQSVIFIELCKLFHKGKCFGKLVMSKSCCRLHDLVKVFSTILETAQNSIQSHISDSSSF